MNNLDRDVINLRAKQQVLASYERLISNPDFKKVFLEDFLKTLPIELVLSKANCLADSDASKQIDRQLDCIALFSAHLDKLETHSQTIHAELEAAIDHRTQVNQGLIND